MKVVCQIIVVLFFLFLQLGDGVAQVIHSSAYSVNQGISQSNVTCLEKDQRGFIWVGTQDGLNRFDGYQFKTFKHNPSDTNSLSNNFINDILEAEDGSLWIATNYGLNRYNPLTDQFRIFISRPEEQNSLPENQILKLQEDSQGQIWIKTVHYLVRYHPERNEFTSFKHFNDYFNYYDGTNNFDLLIDRDDKLWVGTKDGLNLFNRELEIFKRYKHDPADPSSLSDNMVQSIYEDARDRLWIGTDNGLNLFDREKHQFKRYYVTHQEQGIDQNSINDILMDEDGLLWVATNAGIFLFYPAEGRFERPGPLIHEPAELRNANITELQQFRSKVLWAGTLQGMVKLQKNLKDFKLYRTNENNEPLFTDNLVASVYKDHLGTVWVGTWDEGLFLFERNTGNMTHYTSDHPYIPSNDIHCLFPDSQGRLWIGTDQGVSWFDLRERSFYHFSNNTGKQIFENNRVYAMDEDQQGRIWFATRNGLHVYDGTELNSFYSQADEPGSLTSSFVYDVMVDSKDRIWVATNKGMNLYLGPGQGFQHFVREELTCTNCLTSNEILCLHEDRHGNIWVGTVGGLNRYDPRSESFVTFTEQDGLPNNLIYAILEDDRGNLWISSNRGLTQMNAQTGDMVNYSIYDGLQDYEFNHLAASKAWDGEMFFGGISGLNSFYPDSIKRSSFVPNIEITSAEVITNRRKNTYNLLGTDTLHLPYNHNLLTVEFVSLDMIAPTKTQYYYQLKGAENEWVDLGNRRYATFSNLPPGKYVLNVRGSNNEHVLNREPELLYIFVETPLWRTRFAYILYGAFGVLMVSLLLRWRTNSLRKANQHLKEREVIAQQVAKQKEELSIKNKSITDSLIYAKRIQESLLPSDHTVRNLFRESFILYKPKDIVSGDFYWVNEVNDKLFIAVVDCTGHGVPGAFMSIIGVELLDNITNEQGITDADKILYDLNKGISLTLTKDNGRSKSIRDGMDVALCVIDKKHKEMEFAGAFRPMYLVRDNKIEEIKGDRFSVGMLEHSMGDKDIRKHRVKLKEDDMIYLFTDGYADQFGGPEGKKYKYRRFRHLLLTIHNLDPDQQRLYLNKSIEDWKGNQEQIDDILVVGFSPRSIVNGRE